MIAIVAIEYRNKTLIERQIENPVQKENFVSQKANCRIHVLFLAIPRGQVHVDDQAYYGQLVNYRKYHQSPIEKDGTSSTDSLDNATVVTDLCYEIQEKLVFPSKFLNNERKIHNLHLAQKGNPGAV